MYIHICICIYVHTYTCMYVYVYTCIYVYVYIYVYMYICTCVYTYARIDIHVCFSICMGDIHFAVQAAKIRNLEGECVFVSVLACLFERERYV